MIAGCMQHTFDIPQIFGCMRHTISLVLASVLSGPKTFDFPQILEMFKESGIAVAGA